MSTILERLQYGFDRDSRRTWRRRAVTTGEDNAYGYDGLSQVTQAALGDLNQNASAISAVPAEMEAWDYDPTGNWRGYQVEEDGSVSLAQQRVYDKGNRLTQISDDPSPVLLDPAGRMTQVSPDASGNWEESQQMTWDAWGRVTQVKRTSDGTVLGSYAYDGLTRRTVRTVGDTTTHSYYSDKWRPLEERTDAETTAATQYYWGARHRDDLVRRDRATTDGGELDETRYVLMDYFSPAAITDETGAVTERYRFSAFGIRTILAPDFNARSESECDFEFSFQGQFLDTESGFLNYGYRHYSPVLGCWLSKDPIGQAVFFEEQTRGRPRRVALNLFRESLVPPYEFVRNCPTTFVDHLGMSVFWNADVCPGFPTVTTRFIQVVSILHSFFHAFSFVDDGTHFATGDPDGGLYPNRLNGVMQQANSLFSDAPGGTFGLTAEYEVCRACVCDRPVTVAGITFPRRVLAVGPCITWYGGDTLFGEFNLATLGTVPNPSDNFTTTVFLAYPNLLPP